MVPDVTNTSGNLCVVFLKGVPAIPAENYRPANFPYRYNDMPIGESTHQQDFTLKPLPEREPRKAQVYEPCAVPMDLTSSHTVAYQHWNDHQKAMPFRPKPHKIRGGRFRGTCTNVNVASSQKYNRTQYLRSSGITKLMNLFALGALGALVALATQAVYSLSSFLCTVALQRNNDVAGVGR